MVVLSRFVVATLIAAASACSATGPARSRQASPPRTPPNAAEPANDLSVPYKGPPVTVALNQHAGAEKATVKVTFPTGGWELKHDRTGVKDRFGVVHFTFSGPAPDDMVAQVLEEKAWTWESAEPFSRAEVWVRIVRRGQPPPSEYRLAAKAP